MHPLGLGASVDLGKMLPSVVDKGSSLNVRTRYKLGSARPAVDVSTKLSSAQLGALQLEAKVSMDDQGKTSSSMRIGGAASGVAAHYEVVSGNGDLRQVAEVLYPAALERGGARAYGRVTQSKKDFGGKPRLQLGLHYDLDVGAMGKQFRLLGASAAYDAGSVLIEENGKPWVDTRLKQAQNTAATLRKRIEGSDGLGHQWLRK